MKVSVDGSLLDFSRVEACDCEGAGRVLRQRIFAAGEVAGRETPWEWVFLTVRCKYGDYYRQLCCLHCDKMLAEARL